jgi:hypothetical protein
MHDCDNNDLVGIGAINQRIRKSLTAASPYIAADLRPELRKVAKLARGGDDFIEEILAQTGRLRIVAALSSSS